MQMAFFIFDEFRNILSILALEMILTLLGMKRRRMFAARLTGGVIVCLIVSTLYVFLHNRLRTGGSMQVILGLSVLWYSCMLLLATLVTALCFHINTAELLWVALTAYAAQHIAYVLVYETLFMGILHMYIDGWLQILTFVAVSAAIDFAVYLIFSPSLRGRDRLYVSDSIKSRLTLGAVLVVFLDSTFINQYNAIQDYQTLIILAVASDLVNCLLVLMVQFMSLRTARLNVEKATISALLENEKKQYETFRSTMDYINIKCHDLKKEIASMVREGRVDEKYIDEIAEQISVYESFVQTGNETLNSLLTDRNLLCLKNNIALSCMADARALNRMEGRHIYALFGNMIDNAIEHVKTISEADRRYIRLLIRHHGGMTIIHQENCLKGALHMEDDLPVTTKDDPAYHGFGMKSMRRIVNKYGGILKIESEDGRFSLEAIIPDEA